MMNARRLVAILLLLAVGLAFQNCGLNVESGFTASFRDPNAEFFNYPYQEKPEFYSHYQLIRQEKENGLRKWRFYGAIAAADSGVPVVYNLKLFSKNGDLLCPTNDATLANGSGTVDFECSTPHDPLETKLVWRITINGQDIELVREQTYAAD